MCFMAVLGLELLLGVVHPIPFYGAIKVFVESQGCARYFFMFVIG